MADYVSRWKGPSIDAGIDEALNGIGCRRFIDCSIGNPLDLNKFHDEYSVSAIKKVDTYGDWLIEHYTNGPFNMASQGPNITFSPIMVSLNQIADQNYQSVTFDDVTYYRLAAKGEDFTDSWHTLTDIRFIDDASTSADMIKIVEPKIQLHDNLCLIVRLKHKLQDNATVQFNDQPAIAIMMADGGSYKSNHTAGSYIALVYSDLDKKFYVVSEGGMTTVLQDITDTLQSIRTEISSKANAVTPQLLQNPGTKVTVNNQGLVTKVEQATAKDIKFDDTHSLEDKITSIDTSSTEIRNEMISFDAVANIPADWVDIT